MTCPVSDALVALLRCDRCGARLVASNTQSLSCTACNRAVPIERGIRRFMEQSVDVMRQFNWWLFVRTKYPLDVPHNDQFARFSAPLETRYGVDEVRALMAAAGLRDVTVRPCFGWIAEGTRPA